MQKKVPRVARLPHHFILSLWRRQGWARFSSGVAVLDTVRTAGGRHVTNLGVSKCCAIDDNTPNSAVRFYKSCVPRVVSMIRYSTSYQQHIVQVHSSWS